MNRRKVADRFLADVEADLEAAGGMEPEETLRKLTEEALDWNLSEEWTLDDLVAIRSRLLFKRDALRRAVAALEARIAGSIGEGGKVRFGEDFFEAKPKTKFRIGDGNEPEFWNRVEAEASRSLSSLEDVFGNLRKSFNLNYIRKGGLSALSDLVAGVPVETVDTETGEIAERVEYLDDLFVTEREEDLSLEVRPLSRAPKFAADLEEGEVRVGRGKGSARS